MNTAHSQSIARVSTFWGNTLLDVAYGGSIADEVAREARPGESRTVKLGALTYVVDWVLRTEALLDETPFDWRYPWVFCVSGLLHVFFVVAALITPSAEHGVDDLVAYRKGTLKNVLFRVVEEKKPQKKLELLAMNSGAGERSRGAEGLAGRKDRPPKEAARSRDGAPRVDPNKRERDRQLVMNTGLLGTLRGLDGSSAASNVLGPGGLGRGINVALGGIRGGASADAGGAGGLGTRGWEAGGGGNAMNIGGLATHGRGPGEGGYANIQLNSGGNCRGCGEIKPVKVKLVGDYPKEWIARTIRRNLARFKYCYERELNADPNLSGKVSVRFTVGPNGLVYDHHVNESTIGSERVEQCVTKVMGSLEFPKPKGGGIVIVTYPFMFEST